MAEMQAHIILIETDHLLTEEAATLAGTEELREKLSNSSQPLSILDQVLPLFI